MKPYFLLFVLLPFKCLAQGDAEFKVHKVGSVNADSTYRKATAPLSPATFYTEPVDSEQYTTLQAYNFYTLNELNHILEISPELSLISCELSYDSLGRTIKIPWSVNDPASEAAIQHVIDEKPKGRFTFSKIYVMKGRKKIKLTDKSIEVK